jgi:flagellar hook-associated protein 2
MPLIDGIVSGLDTTGLIAAMTAANQSTISVLNQSVSQDQASLSAVSELSGLLGTLSDAIGAIGQNGDLGAIAAQMSQEGPLNVSLGAAATEGTFQVSISQLAKSTIATSAGFADANASGSIAHGPLSVTIGGEEQIIDIDGTNDSLQGLADDLDALEGLQAYVLNTGDADEPYQLVVRGDDTGATNEVQLSGAASADLLMTTTQSADDALLFVDGVAVTSATNNVTIAPGVTLDLATTTTDPVDVTVGLDETILTDQVQAIVDAYNEVVSYYDTNTAYNATAGIRGPLVGDSSARRVVDGLGNTLTDNYADVLPGDLVNLAGLGIQTTQSGELEFDADVFSAALGSNRSATIEALTLDDGPLGSMTTMIADVFVDEDSGVLALRTESLESRIEDTQEQIVSQQERIDAQEALLRAKFTAMETTLSRIQQGTQFLTALMPQNSLM